MADPITRLNAALLGRYEIERELGQGGMATVYLARDVKHNRKVALKVLKPELAVVVGAERFLAEIETTANLQHPHILPLFDSGEADSFLFYVMPYVEGETLADRIEREKQLPVDEALGIATSVASALQHAHDRGVIHRDIKPGNILLADGQPIVADFGIALAVGAGSGARLTETGLSMGTPYYMSPEQAMGDQSVGPASDTYALACVLFEMLVGEPPYPGSNAQAVLGKIIQGIPVSATAARKSIPLNVDGAIRKALEKLPADRFTGAQSFAKALADPTFRYGDGADEVSHAGSVRLRRIAIAGWSAAAIAVAALALAWTSRRSPEPVRRVERFGAPFLTGQEPERIGAAGFALSPDGGMLVYRHTVNGQQVLMVRRWDDVTATPVRETVGGGYPRVSPDGLQLAFFLNGEAKVLAFSGGPVRTLTSGQVSAWGPDGYVYVSNDSGTVRIPSVGGAVEYVSRLAEGETRHAVHDVLPGGRRALLEVGLGGGYEIRGLDLRTGRMTPIVQGRYPRYLPSGHLVFNIGAGTMMAARFDPVKMKLLGTPIAMMDGLAFWSLADDGKLFYATGSVGGPVGPMLQLAWVTRAGQVSPVDPGWTFQRGQNSDQGMSISPDGARVAVREYTSAGYGIYIKNLDTVGPPSRLTFGDTAAKMPVWSPSGQEVTFLSNRGGNFDVWSRPADGTGQAKLILDLKDDLATVGWSPDGKWLLLRTSQNPGSNDQGDILAFRPGEDSVPRSLFADSKYRENDPAVSPDGRWIAYSSDATGQYEVYVTPFPDVSGGQWQVSVDGGRVPRWSHSGRELFWQKNGPRGAMMAVEIKPGTAFAWGAPRVLFEGPQGWVGSARTNNPYDVALDDQRFLIVENAQLSAGGSADSTVVLPRVMLVNNFLEELRTRVPE
jgi:serine/threonine-protein kinase